MEVNYNNYNDGLGVSYGQSPSSRQGYNASTGNKGTDDYNTSLNLLGTLARVEVPFVKVTIGDYTFGVYDSSTGTVRQANETFKVQKVRFPNYVQSLSVTKINGQVNQYILNISFPITDNTDPNFFEKVFSSVSETRKIVFSYGDLSMPTYIYKDEEAMITKISTRFSAKNPVIEYTVEAISSAELLTAGSFNFPAQYIKPSTAILNLLQDKEKNLQEIFYGMRDIGLVEMHNLIANDDQKVQLEMKTNVNILEYLTYLVSCMTPISDKGSGTKSGIYVLNVVDDTSDVFNGPYFTVKKLQTAKLSSDALDVYTIDMGYPSQNIVTDFIVDNDEAYSIFYNYSNKLSPEEYSYRIGDDGKMEPVYSPLISSNNDQFKTTEADRSWWTNVTEYPIKATITLKGLLRPAILMSYVKLNMYYFGKKHISSGLYVISKQVDNIDSTGFKTTLSLVRVASDDDNTVINYSYEGDYIFGTSKNRQQISYTQPKTGDK